MFYKSYAISRFQSTKVYFQPTVTEKYVVVKTVALQFVYKNKMGHSFRTADRNNMIMNLDCGFIWMIK